MLLVLGAAACNPTPSIAPSAAPIATATPAATATPLPPTVEPTEAATAPAETQASGASACEPSDLKASHGLVEGAAGSRLTTVVLSAAVACSVDQFPAFRLRDADGEPLVGAAAGGSGRIELDPDLTYESDVRLANWCADEPAFPLRFELIVAGAGVEVTGATSFPEDGDVPPCSGETAGRILEATAWQPADQLN